MAVPGKSDPHSQSSIRSPVISNSEDVSQSIYDGEEEREKGE